jgi:hypothetical protein
LCTHPHRYSLIYAETVSILAKQNGSSFVPWVSPFDSAETYFDIRAGNVSAADMFRAGEEINDGAVWLIRIAMAVLALAGAALILLALLNFPWVVERWRRLPSRFGKGLVPHPVLRMISGAFLGAALFLIVVGAFWMMYQSLVAIPILGAGIALVLCCPLLLCLSVIAGPMFSDELV